MDNSEKKIYIGMKKTLLYCLLLAATSLQAQEVLPYPTDTVDGKVYYRYMVEKSIGLYRISKNFGVSQEDILKANPELKERGLKFEEVILIPTTLRAVQAVKNVTEPASPMHVEEKVARVEPTERTEQTQAFVAAVLAAKHDTENAAENSAEAASPTSGEDTTEYAELKDSVPEVHYTDTVRLAYLLPLHAEMAQRSPTIDRFFDFYAGSLLALKHHEAGYTDSLGQTHVTYYDVHTYDIGKDTRRLCQLADSGALAQVDAIIGPAYYHQVTTIAQYAQEHQIPVMVPFLQQLPDNSINPYMLKFNPSEDIQTHALMEHLDTLRSSINIVLVDAYTSKTDYSAGIRHLRDSIASRGLPTSHTTIRQILADSVGEALKDSVENILLFHSERYSNVQLLMPYLMSGKRGKRLTILGQYAWQGERILLPLLTTGVFRTPEGEAATRYEQDFAQYFGHPLSSVLPRYDLLGYDLTSYMLEALKGGAFHAPDTLYEGIQSSILFKQTENGGYENTHIIINKR